MKIKKDIDRNSFPVNNSTNLSTWNKEFKQSNIESKRGSGANLKDAIEDRYKEDSIENLGNYRNDDNINFNIPTSNNSKMSFLNNKNPQKGKDFNIVQNSQQCIKNPEDSKQFNIRNSKNGSVSYKSVRSISEDTNKPNNTKNTPNNQSINSNQQNFSQTPVESIQSSGISSIGQRSSLHHFRKMKSIRAKPLTNKNSIEQAEMQRNLLKNNTNSRYSQPIVNTTQSQAHDSNEVVDLGSATSVKVRRQRVLRGGGNNKSASNNFDDGNSSSYLSNKSHSIESNLNNRYSSHFVNDVNNPQSNDIQNDDFSKQLRNPIKVKRNSSKQSKDLSQNSSQMKIEDYNEIIADTNHNTKSSQNKNILRQLPKQINDPRALNNHIRPSLRSRESNGSNIEGDKSISYQTNSSNNSNIMSNQNQIMDDSVNLSMKLQKFINSRQNQHKHLMNGNQLMVKDNKNIAVCSQGANLNNKAYNQSGISGPNNFSNENSLYTSVNKIRGKNNMQKRDFIRSGIIHYQNDPTNINMLTKNAIDKNKINLNGLDVINNHNSLGIEAKPPINNSNTRKYYLNSSNTKSKNSIESSYLIHPNTEIKTYNSELGFDNMSKEKIDVSNNSPIKLTANSVRSDFLVDSLFHKKNNDRKNLSLSEKNDGNKHMTNNNYYEEDQVIFDQHDLQKTNDIHNNDLYYNENNIPIKEVESPKSRSELINERESYDKFDRKSTSFNKKVFDNVLRSKNISYKDTTVHSSDITLQDFMGSHLTKGTENTNHRTRTNSKDMNYKQSRKEN